MNKPLAAGMVAIFMFYAAFANAQSQYDQTKGADNAVKKTVKDFKCEDFLALDDTFKPKAVAWTEGFLKGHKKPAEVSMNIRGVDDITPAVVAACQQSPKVTFWEKVKNAL